MVGDSWGCGVWEKPGVDESPYKEYGGIHEPDCNHRGLGHYIQQAGHTLYNMSVPGSNLDTARFLKYTIGNDTLPKFDCVIVFQTEWYREYTGPVHPQENKWQKFFLTKFNKSTIPLTISRWYTQLSFISQKYEVPCIIIGGASDAIPMDKLSEEYPGLIMGCQSFSHLIFNDTEWNFNPVYAYQAIWFLETCRNLCTNEEDLNFLLNEVDKAEKRLDLWQSNPAHFPDGHHPSKECHEKLFNLLQSKALL